MNEYRFERGSHRVVETIMPMIPRQFETTTSYIETDKYVFLLIIDNRRIVCINRSNRVTIEKNLAGEYLRAQRYSRGKFVWETNHRPVAFFAVYKTR